jgi:hypothetical protein
MLLVLGGAICTSSQGPLSLTSYTAVLEVKSNEPTPFHRSAAALGWRKIMFIFLHQTVCSLLSIQMVSSRHVEPQTHSLHIKQLRNAEN